MRGAGLAIWLGEEAARTPLGSSDVAELKGEEEGSRRARGGLEEGQEREWQSAGGLGPVSLATPSSE